MARPSKFTKEVQRQVELMARKGWTDEEMSELLGINRTTLYNWQKKHPKFFNTLKEWKYAADATIEKSLYETAKEGNTTAQIFWLKNRKRKEWRDQHHIKHGVDDLGDMTDEEIEDELRKCEK